jgi:hypothetical protein
MIVAYLENGWYVIDLETRENKAGPYRDHSDAVRAIETIAFRIAQGWKA